MTDLDRAVWASLTGPHGHLALGTTAAPGAARALSYPPEISVFGALALDHPASVPTDDAWAELAELIGPDADIAQFGTTATIASLPPGWQFLGGTECVQLVGTPALLGRPDPEAVRLGAADAEEMLDLVARTRPGPFQPQTYRLGTYLGVRHEGALVAMAGERLHPPGWTEISAICTAPEYRGRGLAARLTLAVADGIQARGERPFLHAAVTNTAAIRLYQGLGFEVRRRLTAFSVQSPPPPGRRPGGITAEGRGITGGAGRS